MGELHRLLEGCLRFRGPAQGHEARPEQDAGGDVAGIEPRGGPELLGGLRVLASPLVDDAQVVVDERHLAARLRKHAAERGLGFGQPFGLEGGDAFLEGRLQGGRQLRGRGRGGDGQQHSEGEGHSVPEYRTAVAAREDRR